MNPKGKKLSELLQDVPYRVTKGVADPVVTHLAIDSRRVAPGAAFFALPGLRTDGNTFVEEAVSRGAVAVISTQDVRFGNPRASFAMVDNARLSLARAARSFYGFPDRELDLVGITGTNGKTTVAGLAKHLLSNEDTRVGCIGTIGYDLVERTVPSFRTTPEAHDLAQLFSQMRSFGCSKSVMEVSSHAIDQLRIADLEFDVAAFLNLTRDHLDYHGDMESYFESKRRLFSGTVCPSPKTIVLNVDDPYGRRLFDDTELTQEKISFGLGSSSDVRGESLVLRQSESRMKVLWPGGGVEARVPLIGKYNASNFLASIAICYASGQDPEKCIERLETFRGIPGRMEAVDGGQDFKIVVDYAHTEDALRNALKMLREITPGRLLIVFGCGGDRDRGKRVPMTRAAIEQADICFATADNPRSESLDQIFDDMKKGVEPSDEIEFVHDRRRAIELALKHAKANDCVLIAGKGHESFQEFGDTVATFDDRKVAIELLELKRLGEGEAV